MAKCVHVVYIDYSYDVSACLASLRMYADSLGADFDLITERKFPDWPITYEKMQVFERGEGYEWNILFDCDIWVGFEMYDITKLVVPGRIGTYEDYLSRITVKRDEYLTLSEEEKIPATNVIVARGEQRIVWKPFVDLPVEEAISRVSRPHIIDEYCTARNMKQHGIGYSGVIYSEIEGKLFKHHNFLTDLDDRSRRLGKAGLSSGLWP